MMTGWRDDPDSIDWTGKARISVRGGTSGGTDLWVVVPVVLLILLYAGMMLIVIWLVARPYPTEFEKRDAIVRDCLEAEQYTRDECIILAGE